MQLTRLYTDDDAVSSVIAVVLMIAIVVILTGIVASFVLGFGGTTDEPSPTAQLSTKYVQTDDGQTAGFLVIRHNGGDSLLPERTYIRGSGFRDPGTSSFVTGDYQMTDTNTIASPRNWPSAAASGTDGMVVTEDQLNVGVDSDYEIDVVYESEDGQNSAILKSDEGPDA